MLLNALVALLFGLPLSILLLTPVAAVLYRREGRLRPVAVVQLGVAAVYFCALWTYTLLPLPPSREVAACAGPQLRPFAFVGDAVRAGIGSPAAIAQNPALIQVALNVALFVPLGVGVRLLLHRGVVVAGVVGLLASLVIEVTQLTGVYGIYSCAYRLFDVDDLLANTGGALLGSLASVLVVRSGQPRARELVAVPVSLGRRLLGMLGDAVLIGLVQALLTAVGGLWLHYGDGPRLPDALDQVIHWGVPGLLELALVLVLGRTAGEALVLIENEPGTSGRWRQALLGAPGYCLLGAAGTLQGLFVLATLIAVVATRDRRGLSRLLSGGRIRARGSVEADRGAVLRGTRT